MNSPTLLQQIFNRALEIENEVAQNRYITEACEGQEGLAERVVRLLEAYEDANSFLESPFANTRLDAQKVRDDSGFSLATGQDPGSFVQDYEILEKLGAGGFGVVYRVRQHQPMRRELALKLIKPGMDTREVISRFNVERQAMAMMDHPFIATIHDAGATESGYPFFVMELVEGVPLVQFCDQHRLSTTARLRLFVQICEAIQHAHQKGVIHRDLKPSNILVAEKEGSPFPKIIDFGIAKAINDRLTDDSILTKGDQLVGTPLYMSPEQAASRNKDVDVRSDVYSLGVLLFELLTGSTPVQREQIRGQGLESILKLIQECDPPKPSSRLSESAELLDSVANDRSTEPSQLKSLIRGDLDWIVIKALERERNRRYESASSLARDIERFLNDDPVEARPPSTSYRFNKFVRKNRAAVVTAMAFFVVLASTTAFSTWKAIQASQSEARVVEALDAERDARFEETRQKRLAVDAERLAESALESEGKRRRSLESMNQFMLDTFRSPIPGNGGRNFSVLDLLHRRKAELETAFPDDPGTRLAMIRAVGETYLALAFYEESLELLLQAEDMKSDKVAGDARDELKARHSIAQCFLKLGQVEKARSLISELLADERSLPNNTENVVAAMSLRADLLDEQGKYEEAWHLDTQAYRMIEDLPATSPGTHFAVLMALTSSCSSSGRLDQAMEYSNLAHDFARKNFGPDSFQMLEALNALALRKIESNKSSEAATMLTKVAELTKKHCGDEHPLVLVFMSNQASAEYQAGNFGLACDKFSQLRKFHSEHFPDLLSERLPLDLGHATSLMQLGQNMEAVSILEKAQADAGTLGEKHPQLLRVNCMLGQAYSDSGDPESGAALLKKTLKAADQRTDVRPLALLIASSLAKTYAKSGKSRQAIALLRKTLDEQRKLLGDKHPETLMVGHHLGTLYIDIGRHGKAIELLTEVFENRMSTLGKQHPMTWVSAASLGKAKSQIGEHEEALEIIELSVDHLKELFGNEGPMLQSAVTTFGLALTDAGKPKLAVPQLKKAVELGKNCNLDEDRIEAIQINLGFTLKKIGQVDHAIEIYREVLPQRRARLGEFHQRSIQVAGELAHSLIEADREKEATAALRDFFRLIEVDLASQPATLNRFYYNFAVDLFDRGWLSGASECAQGGHRVCSKNFPESMELDIVVCLKARIEIALALSEPDDEHMNEALKRIEESLLKAHQGFLHTKSNSGKAGVDQVKATYQETFVDLYTALENSEEVDQWRKK